MDNPPSYPETGDGTGTPRWVKVFAIIALVVVLLVIGLMFIGGGDHGPSRHAPPSGFTEVKTPPADLGDGTPPDGGPW